MQTSEIDLIVSEPFEFPVNRTTVVVQDRKSRILLLRPKESILYKNSNIIQLVAFPRNDSDTFEVLDSGQKVIVNLTPIVGEEMRPLDECLELAEKWRGWFLIGTVAALK